MWQRQSTSSVQWKDQFLPSDNKGSAENIQSAHLTTLSIIKEAEEKKKKCKKPITSTPKSVKK